MHGNIYLRYINIMSQKQQIAAGNIYYIYMFMYLAQFAFWLFAQKTHRVVSIQSTKLTKMQCFFGEEIGPGGDFLKQIRFTWNSVFHGDSWRFLLPLHGRLNGMEGGYSYELWRYFAVGIPQGFFHSLGWYQRSWTRKRLWMPHIR